MPELPEVEHAVVQLRAAILHRTIVGVDTLHAATARQLPARQARELEGKQVIVVERRGKHQLIHLDDGSTLHAHFLMAGDWWFGTITDSPPRYERVRLRLDGGHVVSLVDPRALASITLLGADSSRPELGPEADDPSLTPADLRAALVGRRSAIKVVLLDQAVLAGLGNIYAAESLWYARIHPAVPAARIGFLRSGRLLDGIRSALAAAAGSSGRYRDGGGEERFAVYGRAGEPCRRCATPIRRTIQGGRSTYYCPGCQRR